MKEKDRQVFEQKIRQIIRLRKLKTAAEKVVPKKQPTIVVEPKPAPAPPPVVRPVRVIGKGGPRPAPTTFDLAPRQYKGRKDKNIFLTGGIGDVITLESFFSDELRNSIETICYATRKAEYVRELLECLPNFPNLKNHVIGWDKFDDFWSFQSKDACLKKYDEIGEKPPAELLDSVDYSILPFFATVTGNSTPFGSSSFLKYKLCDISHFKLPAKYKVICPYTSDKRSDHPHVTILRDFGEDDWLATIEHLKSIGHKGIILNKGNEKCPKDRCLINLTNKTKIAESVEILKNSQGYIGIDSWLSVLAAKLFMYPNLMVKGYKIKQNINKLVYYCPQKDVDFVAPHIVKLTNFQVPEKEKIILGKPLTLRCMNGIGDLCWLMTRIDGLKDKYKIPKLTLKIQLAGDQRDNRALEFIKRFGIADDVISERYSIFKNPSVLNTRLNFIDNGYGEDGVYTMIANPFLEHGGRLEAALPSLEPNWDIMLNRYQQDPLEVEQSEILSQWGRIKSKRVNSHICIHLGAKVDNSKGGMNRGGTWSLEDWNELLNKVRTITDLPIYVIGAKYDKEFSQEFLNLCEAEDVYDLCGETETTLAIEILRKSALNISFASGIGVASVYMYRPTVMFWMPYGYSHYDATEMYFSNSFATNWVPPECLKKKLYYPAFYQGIDTPETVFAAIEKMI